MEASKQLVACFTEKGFFLDYEPVRGATAPSGVKAEEQLYHDVLADKARAFYQMGFRRPASALSPSVRFLWEMSAAFAGRLSRDADIELLRERAEILLPDDTLLGILHKAPLARGLEFITSNWIRQWWDTFSRRFREEISAFPGTVAEYLAQLNPDLHTMGRVFFHLVENRSDEEYPFAFLATYSETAPDGQKAEHLPLKNALLEFREDRDELLALLSCVSKAAQKSDFIAELVESGEIFSPLRFTGDEAYIFLREIPLYEESGVLCRVPDWWKAHPNSLKVSVTIGEQGKGYLGAESLISFSVELSLGGESLTPEEARDLLERTGGLSYIKGKWVEVDPEKLRAALEAYEKARELAGEGMTFAEAMRFTLHSGGAAEGEEAPPVEVSNGQWLQRTLSQLREPAALEPVSPPESFHAQLRAYQQDGLNWLERMARLRFGACLADDMGLGKTVQVIALLESRRQGGAGKALLVVPASLLPNWSHELERFAPSLPFTVLHGAKAAFDPADGAYLYVTTYGMCMRLEALKGAGWDLLILDEAQAIKNPGAKQTRAVKAIPAAERIAMTGTPVENRLSDLWSLFDFLNTGLLGTAKEFDGFTKRLKEDSSGYERLRAIVSPFILRRVKTDRSVIEDLPDKMESKIYTTLTKKQAVLYQSLVKELARTLQDTEGIRRKGVVLASISKFKQICNHPDQFLGQHTYKPDQSGKFEVLREICETVYEKRERMLVFTQFREMTQPLADFMAGVFGREGLVLHGGTPVGKRGALVEQFCGEEYVPFMVLSIKAGGVGLNLTAANHVVHFDRWWNPAVENQATDRVFRIGQQKNVLVHKLITVGTIEEKIDLLIEEKQKLAGDLIASSGEKWITEMDDKELISLFSLEVE